MCRAPLSKVVATQAATIKILMAEREALLAEIASLKSKES
jgi:hypothetical protein